MKNTKNIRSISGPINYQHPSEQPSDLIILSHGYGSCGANMLTLSPALIDLFPRPYFIAPNAPFPYELLTEPTKDSHQWHSLHNREADYMLKEVNIAAPILDNFIDEKLEELSLTGNNLYMVGFSQGTIVNLHTCLRRKKNPPKAMICFSGAMVAPEILKEEKQSSPKVCIIHGNKDEIIDPSLGRVAHHHLVENSINSEFYLIPELAHAINEDAMNAARTFIKSIT